MASRKVTNTPELKTKPPAAPPEDNLMRVSVQVGARRYNEDLAAQVAISPDPETFNASLAINPSRFAEWAMLEALSITEREEIRNRVATLETDIKEREARAYLEVVERPVPIGGKAPTVDAIKALVVIDPARLALVRQRQELETGLLTVEDNTRKLNVGRRAIEEKRDSLMELARNWRKEMDGKLQVRGDEDKSKFRPGGGTSQKS